MSLASLLNQLEETGFYYSVGKNQAYHLLGYFAHMSRILPVEQQKLNKFLESYRSYGKTREEAIENLLIEYQTKHNKNYV